MSKLINELIDLQDTAIKNIKSFACLAIEYSKRDQSIAENFYKLSKQEEKKSKIIQNQIQTLINDERLFNYIVASNIKAFRDAKYMQQIYAGVKRELRNDKGCTMEQEAL